MRQIKLTLAALLMVSPLAAIADLIDFEDLDASDGTFIPQGYNGFSWLGDFGESSWVNNADVAIPGGSAFSGDNFTWSNGGARLILTDGTFNIQSLWINSLFGLDASPDVTFEGWLDGSLIYTLTLGVAHDTWTIANLDFDGIDYFTFDGDVETNLLLDDISFTRAVPEPGTLALLGIGLAGMGLARRRRSA